MIDNNAFGVGAAAAVPTAGTPIARTVSPPRLTSPWSGALRKRYVISPVSPDGHGPEVTGSVAKLSGHLPTAASLVGSLSKNRHQTRKQVKQDVSVLTVPRQTPDKDCRFCRATSVIPICGSPIPRPVSR